ncbi:MAG: M61 family metallopeptidase [Crocinitomicaceae bacterium]|nr:M61 family metallopeptidase [Crocinitomicaceae bacterium]
MLKRLLLFITLIIATYTTATSVDYAIKMPKPQNHYFEVKMSIGDIGGKSIDIKMPVWAPGSYMVREFSKNINLVKAYNEDKKPLIVSKTNKNTWNIKREGSDSIIVKYEVYAFELSVRTSFLDASHGFISGTSIFMYVDGQKENPGKLDIYPHEDFNTITTPLKRSSDSIRYENAKTYYYANFDQLVDSPIEIGNQEVFEFKAANVKHTVAMFGVGNYDVAKLQQDMKRIVETATNVFGENPNKEYTFIIHNVVDGQGGLEHTNSTTLSVNRWGYEGKDYFDFLSLVAHEYFHLWNVKRMRPIELGPFNYDEENYTSLLWVMEGFTSYYDELIMRRAGFFTEQEYLQKFNSTLNYLEGSEGRKVQPVAHASFDAWIKGYRPNENSANTSMSYYSNGHVLAAILDIKIIAKFDGDKCLDDFLQVLYRKFYKKEKRGFTEKEFEQSLSDFLKQDMNDFLNKYVYDTKVPNYTDIFSSVGVKVEYTGQKKTALGIGYNKDNNNAIIKSVRVNSAAENGGLSVNDEIIGFNGFRINGSSLEASLSALKPNQDFNLLIARDEILMDLPLKMGEYEQISYKLTPDNTSDKINLYSQWLKKDFLK